MNNFEEQALKSHNMSLELRKMIDRFQIETTQNPNLNYNHQK